MFAFSMPVIRGPKGPEGYENKWFEAAPGKGWFVVLRLYSPLEAWYNKT